MKKAYSLLIILAFGFGSGLGQASAGGSGQAPDSPANRTSYSAEEFVMGADLSYVNQVLDHGGTYRDSSTVENPYEIFREYGTNVVRLRLWHNPDWVREEVYGNADVPLYSGLGDVTRSMEEAKRRGMAVNLDFHYSDTWADPETQRPPEAWRGIGNMEVLKDSVYAYTRNTLRQLNRQGLMPEYVQIGNETNCGLMFTDTPRDFPSLNVCEGNWENAGEIINSGIRAVREVASNSEVDTKIILHIAQPENVEWWFSEITTSGEVSDFDIIGFSYYTPWSDVKLDEISEQISNFKSTFAKEVMIVETAYPWTLENDDSYPNIFGKNALLDGYPASAKGQKAFMADLTREVIDGGGSGVFYWEPAWISSDMKDKWGTGSSWENNTFFNFQGNTHEGIEYMSLDYEF